MVSVLAFFILPRVLDAGVQVLAAEGYNTVSERRGQGCPVSDLGTFKQLQQTHSRTQIKEWRWARDKEED